MKKKIALDEKNKRTARRKEEKGEKGTGRADMEGDATDRDAANLTLDTHRHTHSTHVRTYTATVGASSTPTEQARREELLRKHKQLQMYSQAHQNSTHSNTNPTLSTRTTHRTSGTTPEDGPSSPVNPLSLSSTYPHTHTHTHPNSTLPPSLYLSVPPSYAEESEEVSIDSKVHVYIQRC